MPSGATGPGEPWAGTGREHWKPQGASRGQEPGVGGGGHPAVLLGIDCFCAGSAPAGRHRRQAGGPRGVESRLPHGYFLAVRGLLVSVESLLEIEEEVACCLQR